MYAIKQSIFDILKIAIDSVLLQNLPRISSLRWTPQTFETTSLGEEQRLGVLESKVSWRVFGPITGNAENALMRSVVIKN
jgi:hypothetical protein